MFGLDIGIGAVLGKIVGLGKSWMDSKEEEKKRIHEFKIMEIEEQAARREHTHEIALINLQIEGKVKEAEIGLDIADTEIMGQAIESQGKASGIRWADAMSKTVRPIVTYLLLGSMFFVTYVVWQRVDGLEAFSVAQVIELFQRIVHEILFLTSSVVSFWFTIRTNRKAG